MCTLMAIYWTQLIQSLKFGWVSWSPASSFAQLLDSWCCLTLWDFVWLLCMPIGLLESLSPTRQYSREHLLYNFVWLKIRAEKAEVWFCPSGRESDRWDRVHAHCNGGLWVSDTCSEVLQQESVATSCLSCGHGLKPDCGNGDPFSFQLVWSIPMLWTCKDVDQPLSAEMSCAVRGNGILAKVHQRSAAGSVWICFSKITKETPLTHREVKPVQDGGNLQAALCAACAVFA